MQTEFDLIGLFAFGISGALMAIRRDFDVVGIAILAVITALGGGIWRDLVLGDTPPRAFTEWEYLVVALTAAAVAFVAHPELERRARSSTAARDRLLRPPKARCTMNALHALNHS